MRNIILKKKLILNCVFVLSIVLFSRAGYCEKINDLKFIDVNNPFINRIPVAVPDFIAIEENQEVLNIMESGNEYLRGLLNFTSYFEVMEHIPKLEGVVSTRIDFKKWKKLQAELLISSAVYCRGSILEMEFRLFDTINQELIIGKRYKGRKKDHNKMVRRFASEIMKKLFNNKGLFESKIAFVSDNTGHKEIYYCDFDGTNITKFTNDKSIAISPSWSYDNKWLAFTSYKRKIPEIFIKSFKGGKGYIVSEGRLNITPSWVPGRLSLAAVFSKDGNPDIYLISGKGKVIKSLVKGWGIDVSPAFSPDGRKMVFVSQRGGSPQIYIKDFDKNLISRLSFYGKYNTSPSWSPTGEFIAFVGLTREDGINIYSIRPDGSDLKQLTMNSKDNEEPTWSTDGSLIAFTSTRNGSKKIFVMARSGDNQKILIDNLPGNQSEPAWSH